MDFIEQWFGISPDGGDGSTEALLIITAVIVVAGLVAAYAARRAGWLRSKSAR
jgi:hypothetical protein